MSVAIRTATRIQDQDDVNVTLGAGVDEYALCWDNDTAKFVLRAIPAVVTDHGALTGLADDDHAQYLLATGARVGASAAAQAFTVGVTVGTVATPATLLQVAETATSSPRGIMSSQHSTSVDGARFHMRKSRGTNASPTVISTGDMLGRLVASGYDGSNYLEMGGIDIVAVGTVASTRVPTEIRFLTATDAAPSVLTQRMVITKGGEVGINTIPTAGYALHVTGGYVKFTSTTSSAALNSIHNLAEGDASLQLAVGTDGVSAANSWAIGADNSANDSLKIGYRIGPALAGPDDNTRLTILIDGNVGIGTTAPATPLHVVSTTAATNAIRNALTLGTDVTDPGVGDVNLGPAILFQAESSTIAAQDQARILSYWSTATHATMASKLAFQTRTAGAALATAMTIDGAGNVGIGTVSPATRFDIDAGAMTMAEMSAPTGVANKATLYSKDNGSGKTQLCVKLGDDVEIVIATQS